MKPMPLSRITSIFNRCLQLFMALLALGFLAGCETTDVQSEKVVTGGKVGVGTWSTRAEFKDIRVTSSDGQIFQCEISEGLSSWERYRGKWTAVDGVLQQSSLRENTRAVLAGSLPWTDYTLELKARKLGGSEGFLILFGMPAADAPVFSWWNLGGWGNSAYAIQSPGIAEERVPGGIEENRWYDIKVVISGVTIETYLDGELIQTAQRTS